MPNVVLSMLGAAVMAVCSAWLNFVDWIGLAAAMLVCSAWPNRMDWMLGTSTGALISMQVAPPNCVDSSTPSSEAMQAARAMPNEVDRMLATYAVAELVAVAAPNEVDRMLTTRCAVATSEPKLVDWMLGTACV